MGVIWSHGHTVANLRQTSVRYKAAGDGLQDDALCLHVGWLAAYVFRGHSLMPTVSVKGRPEIKLSPLHQRVIFVL